MNQPLHTVPFVLFDLESTGLDAQAGHRICEIAAIRIEGRTVTGSLEQLINPEREIDPDAFKVNGITQEMVASAPVFPVIVPQVQALFEGAILVAHNAYFDVGFLTMELQRMGLPPLTNHVIDTLALARRYITARRYNLGSLAASIGTHVPTHRAMSDVVALRSVFEHLVDILYRRDVRTLDDLLRAQRGLLPGDLEGRVSQVISTAIEAGRSLLISYHTAGGEPVERRVQPLGLVVEGRRHLLHAFCYLRNAPRAFSLDRLSLLEGITEERI